MARDKDVFDTIEVQARHVLGLIEAEMADLRERLRKLEDQQARWSAILTGSTPGRGGRKGAPGRRSARPAGEPRLRKERAAGRSPRTSPSVDWDATLQSLPEEFSMAEVAAATPGLSENPRARIVAIARWSRAKQVHKIGDGRYAKGAERARKRAAALKSLERAAPAPSEGEPSPPADSALPPGHGADGGDTAA